MKSARDWMTAQNQLDRAYAPISPKYKTEYDALQEKYNSYITKKNNCLINSSLNFNNFSSSTSINTTTSNAITSSEKSFMEYINLWMDKTELNSFATAWSYYEKAYTYCSKSDIKKTFGIICENLPTLISRVYDLQCTTESNNSNYERAKDYCLKALKYDENLFNTHISLWYAYFRLYDYQSSLSEYWIAKQLAKTENQKELANERRNGMKYLIDDPELPDDIKAILDSIGTSNSSDSLNNNQQTKNISNDKDNLTTKLENMKEWETIEINLQCDEWYTLNEDQTKCVKDTPQQRDLNCKSWYSPLSFLWEDWDTCECPEWYIIDSDNPNYCLINRSQKSFSSRMKNTVDAQCTDDSVIKACDESPLSDSCPAVCLEMYDAIDWMYENWLTIYKDPKQFWVYNEMTREQSSKFFSNFYKTVFEKPLIMPSENPFNDIDNADPTLIDYIKYSYNLWLFKGNNWKFMPFSSITKAQSLAVIIRMVAWVLDESWAKWYSEYLRRAENLSLLDNINYSLETLDNENIRRWDVALILYRLYLSL